MVMETHFRQILWLTYSFALALCVSVFGANPDFRPDFSNPNTWDHNYIAVVRVQVEKNAESNAGNVSLTPTSLLTLQGNPPLWIIPRRTLWFGRAVNAEYGTKQIDIKTNDLLLVTIPRDRDIRVVPAVALFSESVNKNETVLALQQIVALRGNNTRTGLESAVGSQYAITVRYAVRKLLADEKYAPNATFINQLEMWRADESRPMEIRLAINQILARSNDKDVRGRTLDWLKEILTKNKTVDAFDLRPCIERLLPLMPLRADRIDYFKHLLADKSLFVQTRLAASLALTHEACFDYDHPSGPDSNAVFDALVSELNSEDNSLREGGAYMLHQICARITNRTERNSAVQKARQAVSAAIDKETDPGVRQYLKSYLNFIEQVPVIYEKVEEQLHHHQ